MHRQKKKMNGVVTRKPLDAILVRFQIFRSHISGFTLQEIQSLSSYSYIGGKRETKEGKGNSRAAAENQIYVNYDNLLGNKLKNFFNNRKLGFGPKNEEGEGRGKGG